MSDVGVTSQPPFNHVRLIINDCDDPSVNVRSMQAGVIPAAITCLSASSLVGDNSGGFKLLDRGCRDLTDGHDIRAMQAEIVKFQLLYVTQKMSKSKKYHS